MEKEGEGLSVSGRGVGDPGHTDESVESLPKRVVKSGARAKSSEDRKDEAETEERLSI